MKRNDDLFAAVAGAILLLISLTWAWIYALPDPPPLPPSNISENLSESEDMLHRDAGRSYETTLGTRSK